MFKLQHCWTLNFRLRFLTFQKRAFKKASVQKQTNFMSMMPLLPASANFQSTLICQTKQANLFIVLSDQVLEIR